MIGYLMLNLIIRKQSFTSVLQDSFSENFAKSKINISVGDLFFKKMMINTIESA